MLISTFGAIKHKLAEQVIRTFALETAIYRVSKDIDDQIEKNKAEGMERAGPASKGSAIMLLKQPSSRFTARKCLIT